MDPLFLSSTYARLRPDASVETLTVGETFWQRLTAGELGDFHNEYLVACHTCDGDWPMWEMHPNGDEIVCLLSGRVAFTLELCEGNQTIELDEPGAYVVVPKGTWHTASAATPSRMLFITAGEGTQHREVQEEGAIRP